MLVEKALCGKRHRSGVHKGSDLLADGYGRVEVRSRTLPLDGRNEDRLNLPKRKFGEFDWFAGVIFNPDITIKEAFMLPHDAAWECASKNKRGDIKPSDARMHIRYTLITGIVEIEAALNA